MWNIVLFDLDGTLTDSGEGITRCVQYALRKEFGIEVQDLHELDSFVGPPLKEQFMAYAGVSAEDADRAVRAYRERYRTRGIYENHVYEGIPTLLAQLVREHMTLAVASSKPTEFCREILRYFGIEQYFRVIVGSEMNGERTKKEDVLEETLRRLGAQNMRAGVVLVGDRKYDVEGARAAGIGSIGVTYGYGSRKELEAAWPDCIVDSTEELRNVLIGQARDRNLKDSIPVTGEVEGPFPAPVYNYPPQGYAYPPQGYTYPPQGYPYPPQGYPYLPQAYPYPPEGYAYPPQYYPAPYPGAGAGAAPYPDSSVSAFGSPYSAERALNSADGESFLFKLWRILYPLLLDAAASVIVTNAAFAIIIALFGAGSNYAEIYNANSVLILGICDLVLLPVFALLLRADEKRRRLLGRTNRLLKLGKIDVLQIVAVIVLTYCVSTVINILTSWIPLDSAVYDQFDQTMGAANVWVQIFAICITGPVVEELLFRGLIFRRLRDYLGVSAGVIVSALIFALMHGNLYQGAYAFLFGIIMALLYEHFGTIWIPILAHALNNVSATFPIPFLKRQTPLGAYIYEAATVLLTILAAWIIFAKKRRVNAV